MTAGTVMVEISIGELIDKITILRIKCDRFTDPAKRQNVMAELGVLERARADSVAGQASGGRTPEHGAGENALAVLERTLRAINEQIWDFEDTIRAYMRRGDYGADFVAATRAVHSANEERAVCKRRINDLSGSRLIEEKSYWDTAP